MLQLVSPIQGILVILITLGLERALPRLYFDSYEDNYRRALLSTVTLSVFISASGALILFFLSRSFLDTIFQNIEFDPYIKLTILWSYFFVFSVVPKTYLRLEEKALAYLMYSITQFVLQFVIIYFLAIRLYKTAESVLVSYVVSSIILALLGLYILRGKVSFKFDKALFFGIVKFSLPLLPAAVAGWALNLSDRFVLDKFVSLSNIGYYSLGFQITQVITILGIGFLAAYGPLYYKTANLKVTFEEKRRILSFGNKMFSSLMLILTALVICFPSEIVRLIGGEDVLPTVSVIPSLALGSLFALLQGPLNFSMYQDKKTISVSILIILSACSNLALNFFLIPKYGIIGASAATLISFVLYFIAGLFISSRGFYIPLPLMNIVVGVLVIIAQVYFHEEIYLFPRILITTALISFLIIDVISDPSRKLMSTL